jgi:hypothetical protein
VVELLAPGFFASAASFDLPDPPGLLLMPPAGHPVLSSETINDTAYTVQRHELAVFAERGGEQTVPPIVARFSFKRAPLGTNAVSATIKTEPSRFLAAVPPGTEKLGAVISAKDLKIAETWKPEPGKTNVKAGDAFTRTITFSAPETPGMLFPQFPSKAIDGLGIYPKHEVLDRTDRGELQGERRDTITYVCERPGRFTIPGARFTWWDLDAKQLRTADFPERTFDVAANPATAAISAAASHVSEVGPGRSSATWWRWIGWALLVLLLAFVGWKCGLRGWFARVVASLHPIHLQPLNPHSK